VDDYIFKLSDGTKKFVEEEFRETEEIRSHAIKDLREWAAKNPRILSLRLDSKFLLKFLRVKKFSLPMTKETIERYLILRWYEQDGIKFYQNFDLRLPVMQELFDLG
jgi:hypothetical protein